MSPYATRSVDSVAALGEVRLIEAIKRWLGRVNPHPPHGIGDDCAVLPAAAVAQVITTDPVVHGRHFDDSVPARAVGAKLLKRNLSDLAAMGARPTAAVVALTLDPRVSVAWLEQFYRGMAAAARRFDVPIVGGDVAQAPGVVVATLTLLGAAAGARLLTRTGARAGDHLCVTGRLGGSLAGHHYRFTPRLAEGAWLAAQPDVVAMMDLSDGLAKDIASLTPSGLTPVVRSSAVPLSAAARRAAVASGRPSLEHALGDGEDYELLFVVRAGANVTALMRRWRARFATPFTVLGHFARGGIPAGAIDWSRHSAYEHFRPT